MLNLCLRDYNGAWGLFVRYYDSKRRATGFDLSLWPFFVVRLMWKAPELALWTYNYKRFKCYL